jgi:hypothetical protein
MKAKEEHPVTVKHSSVAAIVTDFHSKKHRDLLPIKSTIMSTTNNPNNVKNALLQIGSLTRMGG